jgi:hypothetical protein
MLKQDAMPGIRFVPRVLPAVFCLCRAAILSQGRLGSSAIISVPIPRPGCEYEIFYGLWLV